MVRVLGLPLELQNHPCVKKLFNRVSRVLGGPIALGALVNYYSKVLPITLFCSTITRFTRKRPQSANAPTLKDNTFTV